VERSVLHLLVEQTGVLKLVVSLDVDAFLEAFAPDKPHNY